MSEVAFLVLKRILLEASDMDKLKMHDQMIKKLQNALPCSKGHATNILVSRVIH